MVVEKLWLISAASYRKSKPDMMIMSEESTVLCKTWPYMRVTKYVCGNYSFGQQCGNTENGAHTFESIYYVTVNFTIRWGYM